jgi:hypothetical protein
MRNVTLMLVMCGLASSALAAPVQWRVEDGGNGHWYAVHVDSAGITATQARVIAESLGAQLLEACGTEFDWFYEHAGAQSLAAWRDVNNPTIPQHHGPWIGLQRTEAGFSWPGGATCTFDRWDSGEPTSVPQETAVMFFRYGTPPNNRCHDVPQGSVSNSAALEWSADCNGDGIVDKGQILSGQLADVNQNGVPDVCEGIAPCTAASWALSGPAGFGQRWFHAQTYSPVNSGTLVFGGSNGTSTLGDTWLLNGSGWTQVAVSGPAPRNEASMASLPNGHVLLFGGVVNPMQVFSALADTWKWDGIQWSRITTTTAPTARLGHRMVFDSVRNRVVMFGGLDRNGTLVGDTWEWDGSVWSQVATTGPMPRSEHVMAFDPARGKTVMFGGYNNVDLADTWEWNGTAWTQVAIAGPARSNGVAAYVPQLGGVAIVGGSTSSGVRSDTRVWDGTAWRTLLTSPTLSPRSVFGGSWDSAIGKLVVSGGGNGLGQLYGDFWTLSTDLAIDQNPVSRSVLAGEPVQFQIQYSGAASSLQWMRNGVPVVDGGRISGATTTTLNISSAIGEDAGTYSCAISNGCRDLVSGPAVLVVRPCPADFNRDGVPDLFDYLDFVIALAANDPSSDFNQDNSIDFFDYLDFVAAFAAGC